MSREIDRRDFNQRRTILNRGAELQSLASAVSDHLSGANRICIARLDGVTCNPAAVASEAAPAEAGTYAQRLHCVAPCRDRRRPAYHRAALQLPPVHGRLAREGKAVCAGAAKCGSTGSFYCQTAGQFMKGFRK